MLALFVYALSYLVGAVPFGVLVAKAKGVDIMAVGSGNIGATNVGRSLGRAAGLGVFLLDTFKGTVAALLAQAVLTRQELGMPPIDHAAIAGSAAVMGHLYSPFLKFRGGKGVATGLGAVSAVNFPVGAIALSLFGVILLLSRYVSVSSLLAVALMLPVAFAFHQSPVFFAAFGLVVGGIWLKHAENIKRLFQGTERRVSFSKKSGSATEETHEKDAG